MRYAVIDGGTVTNLALAAPEFAAERGWVEAPGVVSIGWAWDGEAFAAPTPLAPTSEDVNAERDRRLVADFAFMGKQYQRDDKSLARITGAATLAGFAMGAGAGAGNFRWANPSRDFEWIAADNTRTKMDAPTCFAFGQAAANVETNLVFAASALRAMAPIPHDYTDNAYWQ